MNEHEQLEQLMRRELRKLPELRAPETLVHRVMLAVHVKERQPWWQRPWLTWPRPAQWISSALFATTVTALIYFGSQAWQLAGIGNPLDKIWIWFLSLAPLWDWLFGTLWVPERERERLNFGVETRAHTHHTAMGSLMLPFVRAWERLRPPVLVWHIVHAVRPALSVFSKISA